MSVTQASTSTLLFNYLLNQRTLSLVSTLRAASIVILLLPFSCFNNPVQYPSFSSYNCSADRASYANHGNSLGDYTYKILNHNVQVHRHNWFVFREQNFVVLVFMKISDIFVYGKMF